MTIQTETRRINISLRIWRTGWNAGYEPDCFQDLECTFPILNPDRLEGDGAILASDADTDAMIRCWQEECETANSGEDGECLQALGNGDEWVLDVDVDEMG